MEQESTAPENEWTALLEASRHKDAGIRVEAVRKLGRSGEARAIPFLIERLGDSSDKVRWEATKELGKMGMPAVDALLPWLLDNNNKVREGACEALGNLGTGMPFRP